MAMAPYNDTPESGTRNGRPAGRVTGAGALAGGALFVGLIALCALVISYNGIFQFAAYGGHAGSALAHVFPVTYTLLLIMACWVSYLLRGAHPRERLWVDLVLIPVLIMVATTAMLLSNLELVERVPEGVANVIVAVAPLAALLVAFLLWMTVRAHMRRRRRAPVSRPRPSDDPTTVLHARAVVPTAREVEDPDDGGLRTRLLRLGTEERDAEAGPDPDDTQAYRMPAAEVEESVRVRPGPRPSSDEDRRSDHGSRDRWDDDPDDDPNDVRDEEYDEDDLRAPAVPTVLRSAPRPEHDDDDELSAPTFPLPRRGLGGHNAIKLAAEHPPVVPGAAAPDPGPEPVADAYAEPVFPARSADHEDDADGPIVVVPDHLADEGFDHEPPPGDPVSDEDEAPAALPEPDEPPAAVPDDVHEPVAVAAAAPGAGSSTGTVSWSEDGYPEYREADAGFAEYERHPEDHGSAYGPARAAVPAASAGAGAGSAPGADPSDGPVDGDPDGAVDGAADDSAGDVHGDRDPGPALWEPPASSDAGDGVLADYVPPVWTPPEDDGPAFDEELADPEPAPVLDHDTGPTVRAAFRIREAPPVAARPSPVPEAEEAPVQEVPVQEAAVQEAAATEPGPEPERRTGTERETEEALEAGPEPDPVASEDDPLPEVEELPAVTDTRTGSEPGTPPTGREPEQVTRRGRGTPVEKRPMVLKPPRPPMPGFTAGAPRPESRVRPPAPDFATGPPSRRVRSEPLRPDE